MRPSLLTSRGSRWRLAAALSVATVASGCGDLFGPDGSGRIDALPRALTPFETSAIAGSNNFGIDLLREMVEVDERPNVVLSPLSASMALGMALEGASGSTFEGMRQALGLGSMDRTEIVSAYRGLLDLLPRLDPRVKLAIANSVWADEDVPVYESFLDSVREHFDATAAVRDFGEPATLSEINDWANEHTEGLIDHILDGIDPSLAVLLLNAVYFEGRWTYRFDPARTVPAPFTLDDGSTVTVEMMHVSRPKAPYSFSSDMEVVELPYGGGAFSMVIIVPRLRSARELLAEMDVADWDALLAGLHEVTLDEVLLPRFTLSYDAILNGPLAELGMGEAFTPDADFSDLSPAPLCIDFVRQKTWIDVDEEGTRAAAVTSVGIVVVSAPPRIIVDRPFVFAIRERLSGTIVFIGLIGDPTVGDAGPQDDVEGGCSG